MVFILSEGITLSSCDATSYNDTNDRSQIAVETVDFITFVLLLHLLMMNLVIHDGY